MAALDRRGVALVVLACGVAAAATPIVRPVDAQLRDARLSLRPDGGWPDDLVLVPIDDDAFFDYGRWPWPRTRIAELLRETRALGAKTILFDALLAARTQDADDAILEKDLAGTFLPIGYSPTGGPTGPEHSEALQRGALLIASPFDELRAELMVMPLEQFSAASAGIGTTIFFPDGDGAVRGVVPLQGIRGTGASLPFVGLRALMAHRGWPESALRFEARRRLRISADHVLAVDALGAVPLDIVPDGKRPRSVRAADILKKRDVSANAKTLAGALAVVYVDSQTHPDRLETAHGPRTAGGYVVASAIRTFDLARVPRMIPVWWVVAAMALLSIAVSSFLARMPTERILAAAVGALVAFVALAYALVPIADVFLPLAAPTVFLLAAGAGFTGLSARRTREEFERLKALRSVAARGIELEPKTAVVPSRDDLAPGTKPGVASPAGGLPSGPSGSDPVYVSALPLEQPVRVGRYDVVSAIGRGGMGAIFLARDNELKREVALKLLSESEPTSFERFRREAQTIARIEHPNVVRVYEVGFDARVPYFVMEYLPGGTLKSLLRANGERLPWQRSARLLLDVSRGLGAAHALGIVHRDIKPSNVLMKDPEGAVVKLADFGVAKLSQVEGLTQQGMIVGTLGFLAPELVMGVTATTRSDVYSLAVMWFRMMTGRLPFEDVSPAGLVRMARTEIPDPRKLVPLPEPVASLLMAMASLTPEERPIDANAVAAELEVLLR